MVDADRFQLKPIERVPLTEIVADRILSLILEEQYKVGDKLPSQKELEGMLKVSRPSLREALSGLCMLGYIEARAGQGYYIRKKQRDSGIDFSAITNMVNDDKIKFLYEARFVIEPKIAEIAAHRATSDDISRLYGVVKEIEQLLPSAEVLDKGQTFHQYVADATHNPILSQIESTILTLFLELDPYIFSETPSYERDVKTHKVIVERIQARDPHGAHKAALDHLQEFAKELGVKGIYS